MNRISAHPAVMAWPRASSGKPGSDALRPFLGVSSQALGGVSAPPLFPASMTISNLLTQHTVA